MKLSLLGLLVLAACGRSTAFDMPKAPGDQTCGIDEVPCFEPRDGALFATGDCCSRTYVCGGAFPNVGCPAGSCCAAGDTDAPPVAARHAR